MDFNELIHDLQEAHETLLVHREKEEVLVKQEVEILDKLTKKLFPFATKKFINNEEALLIYVYGIDDKSFVSHEVYLTKKNEVVYQVYDKNKYLGYVPEADIRNGFRYMPLEDYLKNKPLKDIFEFFLDRIDVLYEYSNETIHFNKEREEFLRKIKETF